MARVGREFVWVVARRACVAWASFRYGDLWGIRQTLHLAPDGHPILKRVYLDQLARKGAWIGIRARFEGRPTFPHDIFGVFISDGAVIGKNAIIFHQVTIGSEFQPDSMFRGAPVIGDNVYIGAGAKIVGGIRIGDNCRIGVNAAVSGNLPDNTLAVCAPLRRLRVEPSSTTLANRSHYYGQSLSARQLRERTHPVAQGPVPTSPPVVPHARTNPPGTS